MGLLFGQDRRGLERRQFAPEPVIPPYPGWSSQSSTFVASKEQALAVSTVWACVMKIANSVSLMALETFSDRAGYPARVTDPAIVAAPAPHMTQSDFLHQVMVSLLLRGNAYAHIVARDGMMRPTQLELLDPDSVDLRMNQGQVEYWTRTHLGLVEIPGSDVWHLRGMTLPGCKVGLSPIAYGALTMGVELSAAKFARDFFEGGGIPKAVLETDMAIDTEQAQTLKERLMSATRNREPVALGLGVKYVPISVKPDESQFVATLENAVATTARFFDMPPEMIGGSSGHGTVTYANREQRAIDYATYTVSPWLKRLEDAYFPMLPTPWYVSFNESNLLRTDAETQAKVRGIYVAAKILPPSRILRAMNEAPLTEDEKKELELVPLLISPLGRPSGGSPPNVDVPAVSPSQPDPSETPPNADPTKGSP